jgi:hypothetical protein
MIHTRGRRQIKVDLEISLAEIAVRRKSLPHAARVSRTPPAATIQHARVSRTPPAATILHARLPTYTRRLPRERARRRLLRLADLTETTRRSAALRGNCGPAGFDGGLRWGGSVGSCACRRRIGSSLAGAVNRRVQVLLPRGGRGF